MKRIISRKDVCIKCGKEIKEDMNVFMEWDGSMWCEGCIRGSWMKEPQKRNRSLLEKFKKEVFPHGDFSRTPIPFERFIEAYNKLWDLI